MVRNRKAIAERIHSFRRIEERHDVSMPFLAVVTMAANIRYQDRPSYKGKVVFYDRQSNRVTRWHALFEGKWYPVVYDSKRKEIITVLPEGALGSPPDRPK